MAIHIRMFLVILEIGPFEFVKSLLSETLNMFYCKRKSTFTGSNDAMRQQIFLYIAFV